MRDLDYRFRKKILQNELEKNMRAIKASPYYQEKKKSNISGYFIAAIIGMTIGIIVLVKLCQ